MSRAIGIDLGSSSSCVSIWRNGQAEPVINDWGTTVTPSYVSFTDKGRLFGDAAKYRASIHPSNTISNFKSLLGRRFSDPKVQSLISQLPYQVVDRGDIPLIRVDYRGERKEYTPQEIVAMLLRRLKELAELELEQGGDVKQAVIAVPSFFTFVQREAVRDAAHIADLHTLKIVSEATAAAVYYLSSNGGLGKELKNVIVLDFGAASLDTSVVVINERALEVKATTSNPKLGGTHFDDALVTHFASVFRSLHQKDIYGYPRALQKLRHACERAKKHLSFASQIPLEVDSLVEGIGLYSIITQTRFEDLCGKLFEQVAPSVEEALYAAQLNPHQIDEVVITGGSSRIPGIKLLVKRIFDGKTPCMVDPDCSVANGAATLAAILASPGSVESPRFNVHLRLDVTPHRLGVETSGGLMTTIVPRFAQIPIERSMEFTTVWDFQPAIVIRLYEGDHSQARDNLFLGRLKLSLGYPPQPRGVPRIRIVFKVDGAQIVVTAYLLGTEESTTLTLNRGRLARDVANRMQWEARRSRVDEKKDAKRRLKAQADPETRAYYMLSLLNDDGMESHHMEASQRSPPYHDEGEALFESSQREHDWSDQGLDIAVV